MLKALSDRVPRVAPLAIGLLALLGVSVVRLPLIVGADSRDQKTDAVDLETRSNLVDMITWDEPGRKQAWDILREHGGESR